MGAWVKYLKQLNHHEKPENLVIGTYKCADIGKLKRRIAKNNWVPRCSPCPTYPVDFSGVQITLEIYSEVRMNQRDSELGTPSSKCEHHTENGGLSEHYHYHHHPMVKILKLLI